MIELPEEFDSIFRYIVVVSQRAEQIINGAKPRTESRFNKPTLKARDDVDGGEVTWRILTQEELDAHRQAMVEQFKAEMDAAGERESREPIPDVLPTAAAAVDAAPDDEDRDDELMRLQRLLGMTRAAADIADAEDGGDGDTADDADAEDDDAEED